MIYYFKIMTVILPFISFDVIDAVSELIGRIIYFSGNWRIRAISENLLSIGASNFNIKNTFVNMVKNHFEMLKFYRMNKKYINEITEFAADRPFEYYKTNTFILTGHFGNWESASYFISTIGVSPCTVAELVNVGEEMYSIMEMFRVKSGMVVFPLEDLTTPIKLRDS
ncbi:TPA: hypothetical protein DCW38_06250, partial [candidate division WOR-3 bacterium]|nr:hypothetical protein [candidate division WOR-3 bacterium]